MYVIHINWARCRMFAICLLFFASPYFLMRILTTTANRHASRPLPRLESRVNITTSWQKFSELESLKKAMAVRHCKLTRNFVYIKMIKCASETLASVFRRFGYLRNLSFVLPTESKLYVGWPYVLNETFYRANKTREFNILCDHSVYNEAAMAKLMPADTVYIASIRHPYSQFKSMFRYYGVGGIAGIFSKDPVTEYLSNWDKYDAAYHSPDVQKRRHCIPQGLSMTRNLMSFNLGFPTGFPPGSRDLTHDAGAIKKWLHHLEQKFKLIMLVEYLDESLVLLKRMLCWNIWDILYMHKNVGQYEYKREVNYQKNLEMYKNKSHVDFILYEHFEYVFWKKISQQGLGFAEEVEHFKHVQLAFMEFCSEVKEPRQQINFDATQWSVAFTLERTYCRLVSERLMDEVKQYYEKLPVKVVQPNASLFVC